MESSQAVAREKRRTFVTAFGVALAVFLVAAPIAHAITKVEVTKVNKAVKTKDSTGDVINSRAVPDLGLLGADGSEGALDVRTLAGGGGFLGTGDCDLNDSPPDRPNEVTVPAGTDQIITGILVTGDDANVAVTAPELAPTIGPAPVANIRSTTTDPNGFVALGNGLTVFPSSLKFECTAVGGGAGSGDFVVLGQ